MLFTTCTTALAPLPDDAQLNAADFDQLLAVREQVAKVLEPMRANGAIGAALEAEITIAASEEQAAKWQPLADELRFLFISGDVQVRPATTDEVFVSASRHQGQVRALLAPPPDVGRQRRPSELCGPVREQRDRRRRSAELVLMAAPRPHPNALVWLLLSVAIIGLDQWSKGLGAVQPAGVPAGGGHRRLLELVPHLQHGAAFSFLSDAVAGRSTSSPRWRSPSAG